MPVPTFRLRNTLLSVRNLLSGMLEVDPHDDAYFEAVNEVRAKMRMVATWSGVGSTPRANDDFSF